MESLHGDLDNTTFGRALAANGG